MPEQRWMKRVDNGRIVPWSTGKALRKDLIECDQQGNVLRAPEIAPEAVRPISADPFVAAETDRLTVALGEAQADVLNLRVQVTDLKRERDELLSKLQIMTNSMAEEPAKEESDQAQDPKTWQEQLAEEPEVIPPALRNPFDAKDPHFTMETAIDALPMDSNAQSKKILSKLARDVYGVEIDKRMALPKLIESVRQLEKR